MHRLAIIGSGPAGWTAAIYAARADLAPVLYTGLQAGGQLTTTTVVENFPGFPEGITGSELMQRMQDQAVRFGAAVRFATRIERVQRADGHFRLAWSDAVEGTSGEDRAQAVIIATGASARYLGLPGEAGFLDGTGRMSGLSACAVCEGAFYRDVEVAVVGGGDSACEEALFLARYASRVHLVHRRDTLRASRVMAARALAHPRIVPVWNASPLGYRVDAGGRLRGLRLADTRNGGERDLAVDGVFMAIGHRPNTGFLAGSGVDLDEQGYVRVSGGCRTSLPGLFAAGDVRDHDYRQAVTAAGLGCMAALEAERWLAAASHSPSAGLAAGAVH